MTFPEGEVRRQLRASDCHEAADAAALIMSVLLDPQTLLAELESVPDPPEPGPEPEPGLEPEPVAVDEPPPAAADAIAEPMAATPDGPGLRGAFVRVSATGAFGVLPRLGGGPTVAAGYDAGRLRIEGRTYFDAPQSAAFATTSAGARFFAWTFGASACLQPGRARIRVPLCLGPELGWLRAVGEGLTVSRTADRLVALLVGGAGLAYAVWPWLALRVEVDGVVALARPGFVVDDLGLLHRPRPVGVRFGGGLQLRINPRAGSSRRSGR